MAENDFSVGYALGADSNNNSCNDGGWGMNGIGSWIWILLILALLGGGFGGLGGWGSFGSAGAQGMVTRADINEGFALNGITNGITNIQQGICDSTYALNNAISSGFNSANVTMMQGFNGVDRSMCQLGHQISDCCCQTQNAIQNMRYDMATQACDTRNLIQNTARDIIDGQNANTRAILDFMTQDKISTLQAENTSLKFAASQANQNAVLRAAMDANTAEIIRRTGSECPIPAYVVPNPNCCYGNPVGVSYNGSCGRCGSAA